MRCRITVARIKARFHAVSHRKRPYRVKLRLKIRLSVIIDLGGDLVHDIHENQRGAFQPLANL